MRRHHLLVLTILICATLAGSIHAKIPSDLDFWPSHGRVGAIAAIIDCHDGTETLRVATPLPAAPGAGWILAIPATASDVTVTWEDNLPRFSGRIPKSVVHERLDWIPMAAAATQLYPILLYPFFMPSLARSAEIPPPPPDTTHCGIVCMIRAADSPVQATQVIKDAGINLSPTEIQRLCAAADGHHCFALIKVDSVDEYRLRFNSAGYIQSRQFEPP